MKKRDEVGDTAMAPVFVVGCVLLYSLTCPMNYSDMGHLFFYPLYGTYGLRCLYTTGTYLWIYNIIWLMQKVGNDKFNDTVYNYVCGSSLYAYLSHYFFILIISVMIVRPYKMEFIPALFLMIFGTNFLIFITYVPLNFLYELVFPAKVYKKADESSIDKANVEAATQEEKGQMEQEQMAVQKAQNLEGMSNDLEAFDNQDEKSADEIRQDDDQEEKFE